MALKSSKISARKARLAKVDGDFRRTLAQMHREFRAVSVKAEKLFGIQTKDTPHENRMAFHAYIADAKKAFHAGHRASLEARRVGGSTLTRVS